MRFKILFISSWFPNKLEPTNGNFVQRHAEAASLLNDVEILHAIGDFNQSENFIFDDKVNSGIRTLTVYYKNTRNPLVNFRRRMQAYRKGFALINKPDLVHANVLHNNMLFAVYLKKKFRIPFVVTEHWTALQQENVHKTSAQIKLIAKWIGNSAERIMPVSENLLNSLKKLGISTPMKVISNVVNTEIFSLKDSETANEFTFLHVSSLIPRKRVDRIIHVAHRLHTDGFRFRLEVGGDGDVQSLNRLITQMGAQSYITTFGEIPYSEVAEKMRRSNCFILFSENETQGCVILESYASGVPVIATKVGGVPEFVKKDYGVLIERNDEEQLYNAMKEMLQGKITIDKPENLRNFVMENYSREAIANQFTQVYAEVLRK